jgi:hypothetical protein
MSPEIEEDPHAELRANGDQPLPLFPPPAVTHWVVIEHPRCHIDEHGVGIRDGGWRLHPLYTDWPELVRDAVQGIADAEEPRFCFNCHNQLGYRDAGTLAQSWYPVHLIASADGEVTVVCPGCATPF